MTDNTNPFKELGIWPYDKFSVSDVDMSNLFFGEMDIRINEDDTITVSRSLYSGQEIKIEIPELSDFGFIIGGDPSKEIYFGIIIDENKSKLVLSNLNLRLRFPRSIFKPVTLEQGKYKIIPDKFAEFDIAESVFFDNSYEPQIDGLEELTIPPMMIADTGIIIEAEPVKLILSESQAEANSLDPEWQGILIEQANIYLPFDADLSPNNFILTDAAIGSGGFSGKISYNGTFGGKFNGFEISVTKFEIEFIQNAIIDTDINATMKIPFFDEMINVKLSLDLDGNFTVSLENQGNPITLELKDILRFELESLSFSKKGDRLFFTLSGKVIPLICSDILDWPTFEIEKLQIDGNGNVCIDGGWIDLPSKKTFDFYGFAMELINIGFGTTENGKRWIGFNGGIKLLDSLPVCASVEGLKVLWDPDTLNFDIDFSGLGIEFEVPDVLRFKGEVAFKEEQGLYRFDGDIELDLIVLGFSVDAKLVIGRSTNGEDYTFFYIYLGVDLPAGIPLFATGLGIYGLAGLFALNMEPNKPGGMAWYESTNGQPGWYLTTIIEGESTEVGVTDTKKWKNSLDSMAFGAGLTIATLADNGYLFASKVLLVMVFPGPILLLEGRANILKDRSSLNDNPVFRTLAVFDGRAGTLAFNVDAQYKIDEDHGYILDIHAGTDAFFDFNNANNWYLYMGKKTPKSERIRAEFLTLFEANSYFMLDPRSIQTGAWLGYKYSWSFGPLGVKLESWIEGNALLSWKPVQFEGDLSLHGSFELRVFGLGFGLGIDAMLAVKTPNPWYLYILFKIKINLPWFLPDISVEFDLEWGDDDPEIVLPLPLQEVAIEHLITTEKWKLPRGELLRPNYSTKIEGFIDDNFIKNPDDLLAEDEISVNYPQNIPVIPLDGLPRLTFSRNINDDADIGVNIQQIEPEWELIPPEEEESDNGRRQYRFSLQSIALQKWNPDYNNNWETIARDAKSVDHDEKILFGSWAPVPSIPRVEGERDNIPGQTKLWIWSINPFDYTNRVNRSWDEWFTDQYPNYPCMETAPEEIFTFYFSSINIPEDEDLDINSPFKPQGFEINFTWNNQLYQGKIIKLIYQENNNLKQALYFAEIKEQNPLEIELYDFPREVTIFCFGDITLHAITDKNQILYHDENLSEDNQFTFVGSKIRYIKIYGLKVNIQGISYKFGWDPALNNRIEEMIKHNRNEIARWYEEGPVLDPHTIYRLRIKTEVQFKNGDEKSYTIYEYAYFQTQGPPGLAELSEPIGWTKPKGISIDKFISVLNNLKLYIKNTMPKASSKTVFRAYDIGVSFIKNYVELMYKKNKRDLGLYLYDINNQPVRDESGKLIVLDNKWGKLPELDLDYSDEFYVKLITDSTCIDIDPEKISHKDILSNICKTRILNADALYEVRAIPLLLHEDFNCESLDENWMKIDLGDKHGPSNWQIKSENLENADKLYYLIQTSNIHGGSTDLTDPVKPGTILIRGSIEWDDYRLNAIMRSEEDNDAIGIVFRYFNSSNYYLFSMDNERSYRRLICVKNNITKILKEDDYVYEIGRDYIVTIEVIENLISIYLDGELIFNVQDNSIASGKIGLYSWANETAVFSNVTVDDFRNTAPVVYKYQFTTSLFANFFHMIHSFQDKIWEHNINSNETLNSEIKNIIDLSKNFNQHPDIEEAKLFEQLYTLIYDNIYDSLPSELNVTKIMQNDTSLMYLIESPEPIDWSRTELESFYTQKKLDPPLLPSKVKITGANYVKQSIETNDEINITNYNSEYIDLLIRETGDINGINIDYQHFPTLIDDGLNKPSIFYDDFSTDSGELFNEGFGPNALDKWTIFNFGTANKSEWVVVDNESIVQVNSNCKTCILTGDPEWNDYRFRTRLRSTSGQCIGIVFHFQDKLNYYSFTIDNSSGKRRFTRNVNSTHYTMWEDQFSYNKNEAHELCIEIIGKQIIGYMNNSLLFTIYDHGQDRLNKGKIGLYCYHNNTAWFEEVYVESINKPYLLFNSSTSDFGNIEIIDEGNRAGPSNWHIEDNKIVQSSNIYSSNPILPDYPGTYALLKSPKWDNASFFINFSSSDNDAIGVMFRCQDNNNYYRFSMDKERKYRRLTKKIDGLTTILWEDSISYDLNHLYELNIITSDSKITAYLDNELIFDVEDSNLLEGYIALYSWANNGACFEAVRVENIEKSEIMWQFDPTNLNNIEIIDEGNYDTPSKWLIKDEKLIQTSNIYGHKKDMISKPGTYALFNPSFNQDITIKAKLYSIDNDAIGLVFCYKDNNNYYRFSMDKERKYRRLIKKVNGLFIILWEETEGFQTNYIYNLKINIQGINISGYLNENKLFEVNDSTYTQGKIGLYSWANNGAYFEKIIVTDATKKIGNWSIVDQGNTDKPSKWKIKHRALLQTSNIWGGSKDFEELLKPGTYALTGDESWKNIRIIVKMRSDDNDGIGVMFRVMDDQNYYRLSYDKERKYRRLICVKDGAAYTLWQDEFEYHIGIPFIVTIDLIDDRIKIYQNDGIMYDGIDSTHPKGKIGLYCWGNTGARFENVEVQHVPLESTILYRDYFEDNQHFIKEWYTIDEGSGNSLWYTEKNILYQKGIVGKIDPSDQWTMSGTFAYLKKIKYNEIIFQTYLLSSPDKKNDAIGVMFRYKDQNNYYRFLINYTHGNCQLIKKVKGEITPLWKNQFSPELNQLYKLTIAVFHTKIFIYLNDKPLLMINEYDKNLKSGKIGLYCLGNSGAQFSNIRIYPATVMFNEKLFEELGAENIFDRWQVVNEGAENELSNWKAMGGTLLHENLIPEDGDHNKLGTYCYTGNLEWDDYRVIIAMKTTSEDSKNNSTQGGIFFRYQNEQNYYLFLMNHDLTLRQFVKRINNTDEILWSSEQGYSLNEWNLITIDCIKNHFIGYLNGELIFEIEDSSIKNGNIGLYCWHNHKISFSQIQVIPLTYSTYYTFKDEKLQADGKHFRIHSGNELNYQESPDTIEHRFITKFNSTGNFRLPIEGCKIRTRLQDNTIDHETIILPHEVFSKIQQIKTLRSLDKTRMFLIFSNSSTIGSEIPDGKIRLNFKYNRIMEKLTTLSQSGVTSPEDIILDLY